jgi:hypothetical protein
VFVCLFVSTENYRRKFGLFVRRKALCVCVCGDHRMSANPKPSHAEELSRTRQWCIGRLRNLKVERPDEHVDLLLNLPDDQLPSRVHHIIADKSTADKFVGEIVAHRRRLEKIQVDQLLNPADYVAGGVTVYRKKSVEQPPVAK